MAAYGKKPSIPTKIYVGNLPETCRRTDLLGLFEKFGKVVECDIVKNYAFVHFEIPDEAKTAVAALDQSEFQGMQIKVELSISKVRQKPGMGGQDECYRCGKTGHWSKDCPSLGRGRGRDSGGPGAMRRPPPPGDPYRDPYRDPYEPFYRDRYPPPPPDRYRPYPSPYERRPPPPPPSDLYSRDPYERPPPDYYARKETPAPRDPYFYYDRRDYPPPPPLPRY